MVFNAPTLRVRPADPACTVCRGQGFDCLLCSPAGVSSLVQFGLVDEVSSEQASKR
jgi:hypothetical protein